MGRMNRIIYLSYYFICLLKNIFGFFFGGGQIGEKDTFISFDCLFKKKYRASLVSIIFRWGEGTM